MKTSAILRHMQKNAEEVIRVVDNLQTGKYVSEDPDNTDANDAVITLTILGECISERATDLSLHQPTFARYIKRQKTKARGAAQ